MAELSDTDYERLKVALTECMDEQDSDLMMSAFNTNVLISAESDRRFDEEEQGVLRSALLVQRYDIKRGKHPDSGALDLIECWTADRMPNGVAETYPHQYLVEDPEQVAATVARKIGIVARIRALFNK